MPNKIMQNKIMQDKIITIDLDLCIQCEACTDACAVNALEFGSNSFPFPIESLCIHCGDCIEICPVLAISYE